MKDKIFIVGAGLAGLLAAHAWPRAPILEAAPAPREPHRALLRFRTPAVGALTGVEFRKVTVRKGIWEGGEFTRPSIRAANHYEAKVLAAGRLRGDRSIWSIEAAERYIAPDDFYEQLLSQVGSRIDYGNAAQFSEFSRVARDSFMINTSPMPIPLRELNIVAPAAFQRASIRVRRFRLDGCDAFQTIYFPDPELTVYRASITGATMIVELVGDSPKAADVASIMAVERAFGLEGALSSENELPMVEQKYGKIEPINESLRKQMVFRLSHEHRIFSLGRFATWRNILLDDVVNDIAVIKRLMRAAESGSYEARKAAA